MNNVISIFMNYKIQCLVEYGVFLLDDDSPFIRKVFQDYFSLYVDNYYYNIFYTVDDSVYSLDNLCKEFQGTMIEMLDDYRQYELQESNQEYSFHVQAIKGLKDFSLEVLKIDQLKINDKEQLSEAVIEFVENNYFYKEHIKNRLAKFIKMVQKNYNLINKLFNYQDHYYCLNEKSFEGCNEVKYFELDYHIDVLNNYRKTMITRVFFKDELFKDKIECLIQKLSLYILKNIVENKKIPRFIIKLDDSFIKRGKIDSNIFSLIDNHLFRHYVYLGVTYNTYVNQKDAFSEDFHFVCIQDFSHIHDIYKKIENIEKEGIFDYLVLSDYKYKDKEYLLNYEGKTLKILLFEED